MHGTTDHKGDKGTFWYHRVPLGTVLPVVGVLVCILADFLETVVPFVELGTCNEHKTEQTIASLNIYHTGNL